MPDIGKYYIIYMCCIIMTLKLSHFKQQMSISSQYMWARNLGVSGLMIFICSLSWVCSHAICWGQSFGTEGSTFGPTHVVIGRLKVLLTSWPQSSVICHVWLSTACFPTENSPGEREERRRGWGWRWGRREGKNKWAAKIEAALPFITWSWMWYAVTFAVFHWSLLYSIVGGNYRRIWIPGDWDLWEPSWSLRTLSTYHNMSKDMWLL